MKVEHFPAVEPVEGKPAGVKCGGTKVYLADDYGMFDIQQSCWRIDELRELHAILGAILGVDKDKAPEPVVSVAPAHTETPPTHVRLKRYIAHPTDSSKPGLPVGCVIPTASARNQPCHGGSIWTTWPDGVDRFLHDDEWEPAPPPPSPVPPDRRRVVGAVVRGCASTTEFIVISTSGEVRRLEGNVNSATADLFPTDVFVRMATPDELERHGLYPVERDEHGEPVAKDAAKPAPAFDEAVEWHDFVKWTQQRTGNINDPRWVGWLERARRAFDAGGKS